jgi:hypothetical protein
LFDEVSFKLSCKNVRYRPTHRLLSYCREDCSVLMSLSYCVAMLHIMWRSNGCEGVILHKPICVFLQKIWYRVPKCV